MQEPLFKIGDEILNLDESDDFESASGDCGIIIDIVKKFEEGIKLPKTECGFYYLVEENHLSPRYDGNCKVIGYFRRKKRIYPNVWDGEYGIRLLKDVPIKELRERGHSYVRDALTCYVSISQEFRSSGELFSVAVEECRNKNEKMYQKLWSEETARIKRNIDEADKIVR
jgi:hypothetical protein